MTRLALLPILLCSGCILGGLSTQRFSYEIETFDEQGRITSRETVRGNNKTFAGPTKASAFSDRILLIDVTDGKQTISVDMGEKVSVEGGEINPELFRAAINGFTSAITLMP